MDGLGFSGSSLAVASLQIRLLVELVKLVENDENVGNEETEENRFDATCRLVRPNAIEKNQCKLHLKIEAESLCKICIRPWQCARFKVELTC